MSLIEQDTKDCEYLAYFEPKKNLKEVLLKRYVLCNFITKDVKTSSAFEITNTVEGIMYWCMSGNENDLTL